MTGFLDANGSTFSTNRGGPGVSLPDSPFDWVRRRRAERTSRKGHAVRQQAMHKLARLSSQWQVTDVNVLGLSDASDTFLAIGPGGVFLVCMKSQGRARVRLAGDVIAVGGRRMNYITEARRLADLASRAMSRSAGTRIPVTPVVCLSGSGSIDVHGLPKSCLVTTSRGLDHLLGAYGERISSSTVAKLHAVAGHPMTWSPRVTDRQAEEQQQSDPTAADKRPARR